MTYFRGKIAILKPRSAVTKNALICAVVEVLKPYTYLVQKASKSCFFELDLCSVARPCFFDVMMHIGLKSHFERAFIYAMHLEFYEFFFYIRTVKQSQF